MLTYADFMLTYADTHTHTHTHTHTQVLEATLATAEVREALCSKVSKERVLSELNGMLLGPGPSSTAC